MENRRIFNFDSGLLIGAPLIVKCDTTDDQIILMQTEHCIEVLKQVDEKPLVNPSVVFVPANVFILIRELVRFGLCDDGICELN